MGGQVNGSPASLLEAARHAAALAADFLRSEEGRHGTASWSEKGKADYVTEVDRESERLIAQYLQNAFPGSRVLGEELTPSVLSLPSPPSLPSWIVDPLDGTTNFLHRFPFYAVSIAAEVNGRLEAAVVHHVPLGIVYTATRAGGAWQDGTRISVSGRTEPRHALIGTGFPFKHMSHLARYQRQFAAIVERTAGLRRPGSAALDLCEVAAGRYDGFWELELAPWDVAAGTLLIREAGGLVTTLEGSDQVLGHNSIVAGNPAIHGWLLETFSKLEQ